MAKLKIKTGDNVVVTTGEHKGSEGKVMRVFLEKNKAIVEGVNMVSKHEKPSANNPQGGIQDERSSATRSGAGKAHRHGRASSRWNHHSRYR